MAASAASKADAMFYNPCKAITLPIILEEMGHPQPPTNVTVNNSTAHGITQGTMIQKNLKQWTCISIGSSAGRTRPYTLLMPTGEKQPC